MTVRRGVEASGCLRLNSVPAAPASGLAVTLPFAGGTTVDDATTAENDRRPGRPKRGPCHGLGAQGLPAGERATELSYAPRAFITGRAWLERGHPSQVLGCNNHTLIY